MMCCKKTIYRLSLNLCLAGFITGVAFAQAKKSPQGNGDMFNLKPYTEAEIEAVIKKPLKLEDCIRIALGKNIQLQIAKRDLDIAEAAVSGSYSTFFPIFSIAASSQKRNENRPVDPSKPNNPTDLSFDNSSILGEVRQTFITGGVLTITGDFRRDLNSPDKFGAPPTQTQNRGYTIDFTQPLLRGAWFTMARSPIKLADYDRKAQERSFTSAKLQTIFDVKQAYYSVLLRKEIVGANRAAIKRDSTLLRLSQSKFNASLATRRDVLSAEIQLAEDRSSLLSSQSDYEKAMDDLKDVLGLPLETHLELEDVKLSYSTEPLDVDFLIRHAIENNPQIQSLEYAIKRTDLQRRVAKNQLLPRLDLSVQYNGSFDTDTDLNKDIKSNNFLVSLNLSYPFLDRAASANAEKARLALSQQEYRLADMKRQIVRSIRNIVRSTYSSIQEIQVLQRSMDAAVQKVEFATTMFNLGRASNLDITDAQQSLLKSQIQYVQKLIDYHLQLALLETLIGQPIVQ
ncbi:MAG: TolC family protein [Calditrichaeota bacterium]|nr:MAG: TolC family protein [Calditrichota bacterium]